MTVYDHESVRARLMASDAEAAIRVHLSTLMKEKRVIRPEDIGALLRRAGDRGGTLDTVLAQARHMLSSLQERCDDQCRADSVAATIAHGMHVTLHRIGFVQESPAPLAQKLPSKAEDPHVFHLVDLIQHLEERVRTRDGR